MNNVVQALRLKLSLMFATTRAAIGAHIFAGVPLQEMYGSAQLHPSLSVSSKDTIPLT